MFRDAFNSIKFLRVELKRDVAKDRSKEGAERNHPHTDYVELVNDIELSP